MDITKIGITAAKAMEAYEQDFADNETAYISEAAITFEVRYEDEDGRERVRVCSYCTNPSRVYQTGLFQWALDLVQWNDGVWEKDADE